MTRYGTNLFVKGNNYLSQLGQNSKRRGFNEWKHLKQLQGLKMLQAEAYIAHSYILAENGKIYLWGADQDNLYATRLMSYFKKAPFIMSMIKNWKILSFFSLYDSGYPTPHLLDFNPLNDKENDIVKIAIAGSSIAAQSRKGNVYSFGSNQYGLLGQQQAKSREFSQLEFYKTSKDLQAIKGKISAVDISSGYQHLVTLLSDNSISGLGRRNWQQYLAEELLGKKETINDKFIKSVKCEHPNFEQFDYRTDNNIKTDNLINFIRCGFNHTVYVGNNRTTLLVTGFNYHGNCGLDSKIFEICEEYRELEIPFLPGEKIVDVQVGKAHNLILTDMNRLLGFGNNTNNQIPMSATGGEDYGLGMSCPVEINQDLEFNEKIEKIKTGMNRSAVFTDKGRVLVFGGKEASSHHFDDNRHGVVDYSKEFDNRIVDIGFGLLHTLVITE